MKTSRITSYNVCYTKLLRMPSQRIAYGMPNYDLARTKELGRLIIKHGKADLEKT